MKFGPCRLGNAEHALLAHAVSAGGRVYKKGRILTADDLTRFHSEGIREVVIARLEAGDVPEDEAAARIAKRLAGQQVRVGAAFTGRANLFAMADGVMTVERSLIEKINNTDESITVATLAPFARVSARQMLATVKIIPFAVHRSAVERVEQLLAHPRLSVAPFRLRKAALILSSLTGSRPALAEKTRAAIEARLRSIGSELILVRQTEHSADFLAPLLAEAEREADLILVFGASAITDRRDVIPTAIERAGGKVEHLGIPVDPGNLLLVGSLGRANVIGLPGCARSPKLNGFDFVLWRLAAGLPVGRSDIAAMGVGGLLMEIPTRPQPREERTGDVPQAPKIAAVILAAGTSSRMGGNKLLAEVNGGPMVRHVVNAANWSAAAEPVIVVTGSEGDAVKSAIAGAKIEIVENPEFTAGLSSSLKRGIKAVPEDCDGAMILLGDMPGISETLVDKLIAAFNPAEGRAICVATRRGKRGNPVLFARRFFPEIEAIEGDVGARGLIGAYPELVCEVEADDDAPLIDIDTPEALAAYLKERG